MSHQIPSLEFICVLSNKIKKNPFEPDFSQVMRWKTTGYEIVKKEKCKCWLQQTALLRQIYCCVLKHQMPDLFWQEVIYLFLQPHLLPVQNAVPTKPADTRAKKIKSSKNNFRKRLVITNYGLWTCVDRAELGKTD